jgi:glycosyltransferase involved in cell wall biosynthesis
LAKRNSHLTRIAFIVTHPIQYYVPLYKHLALHEEIDLKVFFTWHQGGVPIFDSGFKRPISWDIPLLEGYESELVNNIATEPGSNRFFGIQNPTLLESVLRWQPDVVHVTGWAFSSHLAVLYELYRLGMPTLFRGDSHLLDQQGWGVRWALKQALLSAIYRWPSAFLVTGSANRSYYKAFGVPDAKLYHCPHSIDVGRFSEPDAEYEGQAAAWRRNLGIDERQSVLLFAGKFEEKKCPVELMRAVLACKNRRIVLVLVGGGKLQRVIEDIAAQAPMQFRVLPFQNQLRMPVVYRLADIFVLPSAFNETWGLAVNEALACGRPVLVSNRVGCAQDVVDETCGYVFDFHNPNALCHALGVIDLRREVLAEMKQAARKRACLFDVRVTAESIFLSAKDLVGL